MGEGEGSGGKGGGRREGSGGRGGGGREKGGGREVEVEVGEGKVGGEGRCI